MPLSSKGEDILANMRREYGAEKGENVFYASRNAGTISGVDSIRRRADGIVERADAMCRAGEMADAARRLDTGDLLTGDEGTDA